MNRCLSFLLIAAILAFFPNPAFPENKPVVKIGVLSAMRLKVCMERWQPMARYLTDQIDEAQFEIIPLAYDTVHDAVKSGRVDFILANPSFYVELERWYGVNRVATLKKRSSLLACKTYGGVVFWAKHRTDIRDWPDLKGKRFMAANEFSLGGWRMVWRELKERGINPHRDFGELRFGLTHEDVVEAVAEGRIDVGCVRTGVLEQLIAAHEINRNDVTILNRSDQNDQYFPFLCSTRLYPEWPMAKLKSTPDDLAEKVTIALLRMAPDSNAAAASHCAGWTIPLNYQSVHECLRYLRVGPYEQLGHVSVRDVLHSYWRWLLAVGLACIGSLVFVVAIMRLNSRIRESNEKLKAEMAERRRADEALQHAKEIAEAATRAKSEFLANMSHEIRTPMNGVIAAAELVMNEQLPPKIRHYLKIIHASAHSLLGLINDILDFSKIEAGKMTIATKPFMLDEVIDRVVHLFFNSASEKGIELLVDFHPKTVRSVIGDPMRLQQILTNLVGNSVKFTENGGYILIAVRTEMSSDSSVMFHFRVEDTGVGIPESYLDRLFQPFTQADASDTRRYEGTGLGLSICKRLVEMMGGEIWVESTVGRGSMFYFTITLERQAIDAPRSFDTPEEMQRLRVLVVDDYNVSLSLVSQMLASFGFEVETASTGAEAIEKMQAASQMEAPIGLVIIDWQMPEMDGMETARQIKSVYRTDIPMIMMTVFGKGPQQEDAENLGIGCFLAKPIYSSTLYNAIMDVFGRKDAKRQFVSKTSGSDMTLYKQRLRGFRVLVVEDNPTNSEIAVAILASAGMTADTAENGRVALEKVGRYSYDAILMDVQMPEMNGYEATRQIRSDVRLKTLPIIAMTAHAMRGDEEKCIQAGMDGYVSKPVRQERLFQLLWRLLKNRQPTSIPVPAIDDAAAVEHVVLPDQVNGLRIRESLTVSQLEPAVYVKILERFGINQRHTAEQIAAALADNDRERLALLAHTLKGGAANIGAVDVMAAARNVEDALKHDAPETEIMVLGERLAVSLKTVLVSIEQLAAIENAAPKSGSSVTADHEDGTLRLLRNLQTALKRSDPGMSRLALSALEDVWDRNIYRNIARLVENYDYDDAGRQVDGIIRTLIGKTAEEDLKK